MRKRTPVRMMIPILFCGSLAWLASCGGPSGESAPAALDSGDVAQAKALYASHDCSLCHGSGDEELESGPRLADLAPYWTVERLESYLQDPAAFREANPDFDARRDIEYELEMPAYDEMPPHERRLLARWLLSR